MNSGSVEFRELLREACPVMPGEQMKHWINRLGHVLGIGAARAESIYYDPRCRLTAAEADRVNGALAAHIQSIRHRADELKTRQGVIENEQAQQLHDLLSQALSILGQPAPLADELRPTLARNPVRGRGREVHRAGRLSAA